MGKIRINNLKFYTKNGVLKEERLLGQQLEIDLELVLNLAKAGKTDNVIDTIDYSEINIMISDIIENHSYHLIEALASAILDSIEINYKGKITKSIVRIRKYSVPMPGIFDNVEIEMERELK
ncbi:dihydroneopterin aldolase [Enterococcus faecium]|uniref:dihydroneopterin aldolase n=1 Tax=Enterococcus faecium TaxID=1352 RepID=UPI0022DD3F6E|nr:dihydroneopterin aldolase [Enterococcus faecium]